MSRFVPLALVVLTAMVGRPHDGQGQETESALRARIDSLSSVVAEARAAADARAARDAAAARAAAAAATRVDTLRIGPMTVLTPEGQADRTRRLFQEVWDERFAMLGHSPSLAVTTIVFQQSDERLPIHVDGVAHRVSLSSLATPFRVQRSVADVIAGAMSHDLNTASTRVGAWMQGNPLQTRSLADTYRRIATTHSRVTRACLEGQAAACGSALGLGTERSMEQLEAWFTPEERRSLVADRWFPFRRALRDEYEACVEEGSSSDCDAVLETVLDRDLAPLDGDVRETFVRYVLDVGGEGAWERLIERPEMEPIEAIVHGSGGIEIEELLAGWQAQLVVARPDMHERLIPRSGMTLIWTLVFTALAMRSTRWRFG